MDETEGILASVRVAISTGGLLSAGTGPVRANAELIASLDARLWSIEREVTVETLRLVQASETDAVVDLAATVRVAGRSVHGFSSQGVQRLSGPVAVVREDGEWKVADYLVDGRSLRDSIFTSDQTASIDGLTMSVLGGRTFRRAVWFYIEAQNSSGAAVSISRQGFGWADAGGRWWWWEPVSLAASVLPPGATRMEARSVGSFGSSAKDDGNRRLIFRTDLGVIDIRPASGAPQPRIPLQLRLPPIRSLVLPVALPLAALVLGSAAVASLVLIAMSLLFLALYARRPRRNRHTGVQNNWLTLTATLFVAGLVLFFTGNGTGQARRSWDTYDSWSGLRILLLIWAVITTVGVAIVLRRGRVRPIRRELAGIAAFAASLAIVIGLIDVSAPLALHDQRYYVVEYLPVVQPAAKAATGEVHPSQRPPQTVLSATHVLRRRFTVGAGSSKTTCVLDVWAVKTTTASWWAILSNQAADAKSGRFLGMISYAEKSNYPNAADAVAATIQSDRQQAAGTTYRIPGNPC